MRRLFFLAVLLTVAVAPIFSACSSTNSNSASAEAGIPPGQPCGTSIANSPQTNCLSNPQIPGCYLCVTFPNDASAPLCEFACHLNMSDCPGGRTCVAVGGYASTGCITSDFGYCQ